MSAIERKLDLIDLPNQLDVLPPPGLTAIKANECEMKLRPLAPDHAKPYYMRMTDEHREEIRTRNESKNKALTQKRKAKKAKIKEANRRR